MSTQPSRDDEESCHWNHENPDHLEELYPLMFSKLTGEITIGEDQRLSKLLESPEASAIWASFQKTYNDPEKLSRAISLVSKDDADDIARLLLKEQQRRKKRSVFTGLAFFCLAAIAAFLWHQRDSKLQENTADGNMLNITVIDKGKTDSHVYALSAGLNQLDAYGIALYDTNRHSVKISPGREGSEKQYILNVPAGLQCSITLPDSSNVLVNAESKLSFPSAFNGRSRKVALTGEAVFSVQGNASRPFLVELKKSTVEVLGTVFSVNTYDSTDKISLKEGLVAVAVAGLPSQHLFPGQTAIASDKHIDVCTTLSLPVQWKNGLYDLKDIPLRQLAPILKRRFSIRMVFEPGYPEDTYTGVIYPDEPIGSFIETLRRVCKNSRFELHDDILYIKK